MFDEICKKLGKKPPLHPLLAALSIVLYQNGDLSLITEAHPDLDEHRAYKRNVRFRDLTEPTGDRWWERLGMFQSYLFLH